MIPPGSDMAESEKMMVDGRGKREGGTRIAPTKVHFDARSCWAQGTGDGALDIHAFAAGGGRVGS